MANSGGTLNLVARGSNDGILVGDPKLNFFKTTFKQYSNFGMQKFRVDYVGQRELRLTESSKFSFTIPRYADMLMDSYVVVSLPPIWSPIYHPSDETQQNWSAYDFRWIRDMGFQMITEIEIVCGNVTLQKYSGDYLSAVCQRDYSAEKQQKVNEMTGNVASLFEPASAFGRVNTYPSAYYTTTQTGAEPSIRGRQLYIPINAWFTEKASSAFPLCCLLYNELTINITMRPIQELFQVRDIFDVANNYPYIQPDFNQSQFQMFRFLQTPPQVVLNDAAYENRNSIWNADIHMICNYAFLDKDTVKKFTHPDPDKAQAVYLIRDVFTYRFDHIAGTHRVKLLSSNGLVANWMFYFQRNDVNMRNEWSNYTNWPYSQLPSDIRPAPQFDLNSPIVDEKGANIGPLVDSVGNNTGYFITGDFNPDNQRNILQTMALLVNGSYRENTLEEGVFNYVEKFTRTSGSAQDGIYCYQFCLDSNTSNSQPSGALNLSTLRNTEFEFNTFTPAINTTVPFNVVCDSSGNPVGVTKFNWKLYNYNYNLVVHEERYNIISFVAGNCGIMFAR
jgi:hypothetical protein